MPRVAEASFISKRRKDPPIPLSSLLMRRSLIGRQKVTNHLCQTRKVGTGQEQNMTQYGDRGPGPLMPE